jgi:putative heme utilization carrier protein HutX
MFDHLVTPELRDAVQAAVKDSPDIMLHTLAQRCGATEGAVACALPADMRRFAPADAFDAVWEDMTGWEKVTLIAMTPGAVVEVKGRLPKGRRGHGMFNLHDAENPLGGHVFVERLGAVCFLSKPFFGLESHSVQFYDTDGAAMFAVYAGREGRALIPAVREAFLALRDRVCAGPALAASATDGDDTGEDAGEVAA